MTERYLKTAANLPKATYLRYLAKYFVCRLQTPLSAIYTYFVYWIETLLKTFLVKVALILINSDSVSKKIQDVVTRYDQLRYRCESI